MRYIPPPSPEHARAPVAPENFLPLVLCQVEEGVRGKDDGAVRQCGVADAEVLLDALNGGGQVQRHTGELLGCLANIGLVGGLGRLDCRVHVLDDLLGNVVSQAVVIANQQRHASRVRCRLALGLAGDVNLDAHELRELAIRRLDWCQREQVPERSSVLAVVEESHRHGLCLFNGIPDLLNLFRVGSLALEEAAV